MTRITSMTELRQSMILFFRVIVCAAFFLMMAELLSSCEHKDLCYDHPHRQNVEVMFDWSADPEANPATMSLYLYPEEGGDPIRYEFTDKNGGNISVAAGTYRAICVNSDKETHRILGKDRFETFQVTSAETRALQGLLATMAGAAPMGRGTEKERMMQQPEMLWSSHADRIVVKPAGEKTVIKMKPEPRVKRCTVEIKNVENINGVKAMSASVSGMTGGWLAGLDQLSDEKVTMPFVAEADAANKMVKGSLTLFGHCPVQPNKHILMVYAQLTDGTNWYYEKDVTDQVHDKNQEDDTHIKIELEQLPLPKPAPGTDGGLQPSVSKWNEIYIDIKM